MKKFSDMGIKVETQSFIGDKIKIERILNREITVENFKIEDSKFTGLRLVLQIVLGQTKHVVFTGSVFLMELIKKVPTDSFPFVTTIVRENEHFEFT